MLYHMGDTADILKISKSIVIGENENYAFYFTEKLNGLFGQPNIKLYFNIYNLSLG